MYTTPNFDQRYVHVCLYFVGKLSANSLSCRWTELNVEMHLGLNKYNNQWFAEQTYDSKVKDTCCFATSDEFGVDFNYFSSALYGSQYWTREISSYFRLGFVNSVQLFYWIRVKFWRNHIRKGTKGNFRLRIGYGCSR